MTALWLGKHGVASIGAITWREARRHLFVICRLVKGFLINISRQFISILFPESRLEMSRDEYSVALSLRFPVSARIKAGL